MRAKIEKQGTYKGYSYFVRLIENHDPYFSVSPSVWRCGYVVIPVGHRLHGVDYADNDYDNEVSDLDVHGGIIYSNYLSNIKGYAKSLNWCLGFDCNHWQDSIEYWTLDRVELEIFKMVDQIVENDNEVVV